MMGEHMQWLSEQSGSHFFHSHLTFFICADSWKTEGERPFKRDLISGYSLYYLGVI